MQAPDNRTDQSGRSSVLALKYACCTGNLLQLDLGQRASEGPRRSETTIDKASRKAHSHFAKVQRDLLVQR
jgi:hypothetical protein